MLNAVAIVGGGMWVQRKIGELNLPQFSRPMDDVGAFRFSVHVHSASLRGVTDPSVLKRERPRVEVVVGQARKQTELGDFRAETARDGISSAKAADDTEKRKDGEGSAEGQLYSWTFGDTLTFSATRADILGFGVQVWLRTHGEVRLGTLLQVNMSQTCEVGMCSLDLRRRILPACVPRGSPDSTGGSNELPTTAPAIWESPLMTLPVTHVGGGRPLGDKPFVVGETPGQVTLSFSVNMDPDLLLKSAEEASMPLVQRVSQPLRDFSAKTVGAASATHEWARKTAGVAIPVAQEWTVKAAGVTVQAVKSAHSAIEEPMRWVIENADLETCTTKTRDRAGRLMDGYDCGQGACHQDATPTPVSQQPTARAFMVPKSPTKSQATTALGSRAPSSSSGFGSGVGAVGFAASPEQAATQVAPSQPAMGSRVLSGACGSAAVPAGAARASAAPPACTPAAAAGAPSEAQLPAPPPTAAALAAQRAQAAHAAARAGQRGYYVPAGQPGLPSRQSFQVQQALPTRQSFQVLHVTPGGYQQPGLASRQSFQVVQTPQIRQAPPQYVRPGTVS
mmetsp:Transcript_68501/g.198720  ORF Transcript_68501/g.198720 Transcript_68501/m.198720 type:complete len:564 (-) Transcript_68501:44-1735(-)